MSFRKTLRNSMRSLGLSAATPTIIAIGTNSTGLFDPAPGIPATTFLHTTRNAPTTPTGTPFSVVWANSSGAFFVLYEANSAGFYQVVGSVLSGN
jgi:hypothetical protein